MTRPPTRRSWIPGVFVLAFATVVAANGALIYFATRSWTGLANESAYEYGRTYNRVLDQAAREAALGWQLAIDFKPAAAGRTDAELTVTAIDRDGTPLSGLEIEAQIERPVGLRSTVAARLRRVAEGRYAASVELPQHGQWDVRVRAMRGTDLVDAATRVFLP